MIHPVTLVPVAVSVRLVARRLFTGRVALRCAGCRHLLSEHVGAGGCWCDNCFPA